MKFSIEVLVYGGRVVLPPFDAPRVRMTVISDPQGATFIASKFVPEGKGPGQESLVLEPMRPRRAAVLYPR